MINNKFYVMIFLLLGSVNTLWGIDVIAHRAASGYLPEHTMEAVAMAYGFQSQYIEQDVVLSKDNIPVVLHDIYLDDNTNVKEVFPTRKRKDGRYYAIDFTLAEIKQLSVYERFDYKTGKNVFPNRFPNKQGNFTVPTLEEEIIFIKGANFSSKKNVGIYVEIKNPEFHNAEGKDISKITLNILGKYNYKTKADNFYLQIFSFAELKRIRTDLKFKGKLIQLITTNDDKLNPKLELTDYNYLLTKEGINEISKYADGIGPWIPQLITKEKGKITPSSLIKYAKDSNLLIHPYTLRLDSLPKDFNSIEDLYNFLINVAKVDGFFTDFPDHALKYINNLK